MLQNLLIINSDDWYFKYSWYEQHCNWHIIYYTLTRDVGYDSRVLVLTFCLVVIWAT